MINVCCNTVPTMQFTLQDDLLINTVFRSLTTDYMIHLVKCIVQLDKVITAFSKGWLMPTGISAERKVTLVVVTYLCNHFERN